MLDISRSALYSGEYCCEQKLRLDQWLVERVHQLIQQHPTYGYRRIWALLRFREGKFVNRKKVYRLMKIKG